MVMSPRNGGARPAVTCKSPPRPPLQGRADDAVRCVGGCSALRWRMQRHALADAAACVGGCGGMRWRAKAGTLSGKRECREPGGRFPPRAKCPRAPAAACAKGCPAGLGLPYRPSSRETLKGEFPPVGPASGATSSAKSGRQARAAPLARPPRAAIPSPAGEAVG